MPRRTEIHGCLYNRGFTLIEMLVVLLIAGLFAALVSSVAHPDDKALLRGEAERLAQLFELAATEARLTGKTLSWTGDAASYRFSRLRDESTWTPIGESEALRSRSLPYGMSISSLRVENVPVRSGLRLEFAAYGATPLFALGMSMGTERYQIIGSPVGQVRVISNEALSDAETALR
jgi:general secretion pathway protein H